MLFLILGITNIIFAETELDDFIKLRLNSFSKKTNYSKQDFFSNKSIIVWGTNSDDEDEADVNEMMAESVIDFRIKRWLHKKDNVIKIIEDSELSKEDIQKYNLILVGTPSSNIWIKKIEKFLPIKITEDKIQIKDKVFNGDEIGVNYKFINPYNPKTQVWIVSAPNYEALRFIPKDEDYCVYQLTSYNPSADRFKELALGNFSSNWKISDVKLIDNKLIPTDDKLPIKLLEDKYYESPAWVKHGVMYEIFVRSFYDSDGDGIGDLNGITEKLDYLNDGNPDTNDDLGISVIWLMPIFESPSYHGYDVTNYYKINPGYGTNEDFQNLLKEAHKRGIKIITDLVLNHCSSQHRFYKDACGNLKSKYANWFYFTNPSHTKANNWEFRHNKKDLDMLNPPMPAWNVNNPEVNKYLFEAAKYWIDPNKDGDFSDGIDGFRCDYVKGPPTNFWKNFRQEVKSVNPNILLLAEDWEGLDSIIRDFDNEFDMAFDFPFQGSLMETITGANASDLRRLISTETDMLPKNATMNHFVNNHDMNRIATRLKPKQVKMSLSTLLTLPQMPMLYYGDEIGMKGEKDPYDEGIRRPMEWSNGVNAGFSSSTPWNAVNSNYHTYNVERELSEENSILNNYKKFIKLRNNHLALSIGTYQPLHSSKDNVFPYLREYNGDNILLVANFNSTNVDIVNISVSKTNITAGNYQIVNLDDNSNKNIEIGNSGNFSASIRNLNQREMKIFQLIKIDK